MRAPKLPVPLILCGLLATVSRVNRSEKFLKAAHRTRYVGFARRRSGLQCFLVRTWENPPPWATHSAGLGSYRDFFHCRLHLPTCFSTFIASRWLLAINNPS